MTLPWEKSDGRPTTVTLTLYSREKKALARNYINTFVWKPALKRAGVPATRENGSHALRHFYASTALHEGESIKALSEYLGHADPGLTLRTYTHLVEGSAERTKRAVDAVFGHETPDLPADEAIEAEGQPIEDTLRSTRKTTMSLRTSSRHSARVSVIVDTCSKSSRQTNSRDG